MEAAYYLDPRTGGWSRWFSGRPEISTLTTLNNLQGIITLGTASFTLAVDKFGEGVINSSPGGIDCGKDCTSQSVSFPSGSSVVLTATAEPGSTFSHWSGCDSVTDNSCTVNVDQDKTVFATFAFSEVKIPETTKVLDEATMQMLVRQEGSTYYFQPQAQAAAGLQPGDVIVSAAGGALLRKVTAISTTAQQIAVQTAPATLEDIVERGTIVVHQVLAPTQPASHPGVVTQGDLVSQAGSSSWGFTIPINVQLGSGPAGFTVSGQVSFNAELDIAISFDGWDWNCWCYPVKEARAILIFETTSTLNGAGGSVSAEQEIWECGVGCLPTIVVMVGPVPVVFQPEASLNVGASIGATADLGAGLTVQNRFRTGVGYLRGQGWRSVNEYAPTFSASQPTITGSAEAKVYLEGQIGAKVYWVVGPYFGLEGFLQFEAEPSEMPWWTLYGGIGASAGIEAEVLSSTLADFSWPFWEQKWPLLQAPTYTLSVSRVGQGTVASGPPGIQCGTDCSETYNGFITTVTLTATPDPGWQLSSWSGCDSVSGATCTVSISSDRSVTAVFTSQPAPPSTWRETEDFQTGDPLSRWQLSPPGGCVPTSSEVNQSIDGYLRQEAQGGQMDGKDCVSFTATRDFAVPPGFSIETLDLAVSWRVPQFSSPADTQGGKEGYASIALYFLDSQGRRLVDSQDPRVDRLEYRVSCDDRSGQGTSYCTPPLYGMSGEFLPRVVLVHGQGQEPNWQRLNVRPSSDFSLDWSRVRTVRVAFEFAAGWMYEDSWAVEWDDLELEATP
ncbi:MAG: hypothetical protein QN152_13245 [Armatimonadota bacterium]|nr:hypothetical protein [Armatimonadota bacterium]